MLMVVVADVSGIIRFPLNFVGDIAASLAVMVVDCSFWMIGHTSFNGRRESMNRLADPRDQGARTAQDCRPSKPFFFFLVFCYKVSLPYPCTCCCCTRPTLNLQSQE